MAGQTVDVDATGKVAEEAGRGIGYAMGTTKPSDGALGYAPHCVFAASDGLYVNVGTAAACNFDPLPTSAADGSITADTISEFTTDAGVTVTSVFGVGHSGTLTTRAGIKSIHLSIATAVTVPAITDHDIAKVDIDSEESFIAYNTAPGDAVIAIPTEAMETNARILSCYVSEDDQITLVFGSEGGNVTGGAKNFKFLAFDLT